jgi:hypothetical protein
MMEPSQATNGARVSSGAGAAALLSCGLGVFSLAVLAIIGDHSAAFKKMLTFYIPTGPLSGVATLAVAVWLLSWFGLDSFWKRSDSKGWAITAGLVLLTLGFLLMIPPVADLF